MFCLSLVLSRFLFACLFLFSLAFRVCSFICSRFVLGGFFFVSHWRCFLFALRTLRSRLPFLCFLLHFCLSFGCSLALSLCLFVGVGCLSACFLCSTSPPGGNQVDGLPPALSYSSSRNAEAANLCSTSHLILRGSAPKRSKMLAWGAGESTFRKKSSKTDIFKISSPGLWAAADNWHIGHT